jgi:4-hydroxy-2-oxoheptanedioate aldolase
MQTPVNTFKQALAQGRPQIGLWLGLANAYTADICAGAGFDWLLIDGEHAPNGLTDVLAQLQAIAAYPAAHPIVRVPYGHGDAGAALIKQVLDLGAPTLLVPMVDTPEQAAALVRATRYPQDDDLHAPQRGIRGMAGARASRWGRHPHYAKEANDQVCLLIQAETRLALQNLDALAATPGVHGVFIGPADLSASMGHVGRPNHPEVQAAIEDGIARIRRAGKAAGILTSDEAQARHYLALGAQFVAVGLDTQILARQTSALAAAFKGAAPAAAPAASVY